MEFPVHDLRDKVDPFIRRYIIPGYRLHLLNYLRGLCLFIHVPLEGVDYFDQKLEAGMVVAVEPKFIFPSQRVAGLENDYVMTAREVERLALTDQVVIRL